MVDQTFEKPQTLQYQRRMKAQLKTLFASILLMLITGFGAFAAVSEKHALGDFASTQQHVGQNPSTIQLVSLGIFTNSVESTAECCNATNRILPDEILDQADLNRFANLRNDLGITSNNQLRRNVAVGEGSIDGVDIGEVIGVSGRRGPGVEMPDNPIFTTTTVGHPRNLDSEVFVLENLAQRLTPQSTGTIRLLSERTVCGSCQGVITQFREMFPNINLIVRAGGQ